MGPQFQAERLFDEDDAVRLEISEALSQHKRLVPVLLEGGRMPAGREVPEELRPFCNVNAARLRPRPDFDPDITRLITALRQPRPSPPGTPSTPKPANDPPAGAPSRSSLAGWPGISPSSRRRMTAAASGSSRPTKAPPPEAPAPEPLTNPQPPAPKAPAVSPSPPTPEVLAIGAIPTDRPPRMVGDGRGAQDFLSNAWMSEFFQLRNRAPVTCKDATWGVSVTDQHDLSFSFTTRGGKVVSWQRARGGADLLRSRRELWTDLVTTRGRSPAASALSGHSTESRGRVIADFTNPPFGMDPSRGPASPAEGRTSRASRSVTKPPPSDRPATRPQPTAAMDTADVWQGLSMMASLALVLVATWMVIGIGPGTGGFRALSIREAAGALAIEVSCVLIGFVFVGLAEDAVERGKSGDVGCVLAIGNGVAGVLLFLGAVPLLRVGFVPAWVVVIGCSALAPPVAVVAVRARPSLVPAAVYAAAVQHLALAAVVLGTAQAAVGDTEGFWGILGRIVDDGSFGEG